ncbi:hypothetical protein N7475_002648 [Penicillium sp. IBT 31633x]|nr:hypothetical protein N7475_002648 [Penicillium sp. IBT 31633x]
MPLSWDPRRMWSDNPAAGASKDLPNEEIVDSSPKSVSTAFAARSDSPKRFRFVMGVSRPRKRRRGNSPQKEHGNHPVDLEHSSAVTPEVMLRATGQNLEIFDDQQREGNSSTSLELQDGHLFDDFGLFDSLLPNIFASTPLLDIEPQETVTTRVPGLIETPEMTPFSLADRPVEPSLQNSQVSPTAQNVDPMFQNEAEQNVLGDLVARSTQNSTRSGAQSRVHNMSTISEISFNDHEKLLELCKSPSLHTGLQ